MGESPTSGPRQAPADERASSRLWRELGTVPNIMSLSRIFLIAGAVGFYVEDFPIVGLVLGFLTGLSDYVDGWLARRWNQVTDLGGILDRLGDLVFEMAAFVLAIYLHVLSPWFFLAYILREVFVMSARQYVAENKERGTLMKTSIFGKLKTNFFGYTFLIVFFANAGVLEDREIVGTLNDVAIVGVSLGLLWSYISGYQYLSAFARTYDRG